MQGIILVGGEGTRLQPLTCATPKAMVPILGRPFLEHMLVYLRGYGVDQVTLALGHKAEPVIDYFGDGSRWAIRLTTAVESAPLGSGGAIKQFENDLTRPFFVFNGDILTNTDLGAMREAHERAHAALSIFLIEVDDPSSFGVAALDGERRIRAFVEKPPAAETPSRWINAGIWLFEPRVLSRIAAARRSMVETELFPELIAAGEHVQGYTDRCFWVDIGTPERYLAVQLRMLEEPALRLLPLDTWPGTPFLRAADEGAEPPVVDAAARVRGPVLLGAGTHVESGATIEGPAVVGAGARLGTKSQLTRSVLWDGVELDERAIVAGSVLASYVQVGAAGRLNRVVAGARATFAQGSMVTDQRVDPQVAWAQTK